MKTPIAPNRPGLRCRGFLAIAASSALLVTMAGCSQATSPAASSSSADVEALAVDAAAVKLLPSGIAASKALRVAIPTNEPPTQFYEEGTQHMTGVNPDIARLIGEALGLKVEISVANFDSIIPGMAAGRYDMTVSSMTPLHERMKVLDFVDYMKMGSTLAVAKGNPSKLTLTTLCGQKVGFLTGSYQLGTYIPEFDKACAEASKPKVQTNEFQDTRQAISALTSSRVDAVLADSPILSYAAKQNPDIEIADTYDFTPVSVGVTKDPKLLPAIAAAVAYVIKSDAYQAALDKYGLGPGAITDAQVNAAQG